MKISGNELCEVIVEQTVKIRRLEMALAEKDELLQKLIQDTKPKTAAVQAETQV